MSWKAALESGFEPRPYGYLEQGLPPGGAEALLDCKIWAKNVMGVNCYITDRNTGRKFVLTVYRYREDKEYQLPGIPIDFASCPVGKNYKVSVALNRKGRLFFCHAELIG